MIRIMLVFGTRPEAIKMAPVVLELDRQRSRGCPVEPLVCVTAQHRRMLDQVLALFGIVPDFDLDIMQPGQGLSTLTARILERAGEVMEHTGPDMVLVHGDTTTTFAGALAAYYRHIPVGHVEAGLRTHDKYRPFPEEANRRLTGALAEVHFAPTETAKANLLQENIPPANILVTGNTVVDALQHIACRVRKNPSCPLSRYAVELEPLDCMKRTGRIVLVTGHRRESFGQGFENICMAISDLARCWPDVEFVYPVHLNPCVFEPVNRFIGNRDNIHLLPPLDYEPFVALMSRAYLVLTDSGGIQEEAPSLGKPVIVMREVTERPEAVDAGTVRLAGTDRQRIFHEVDRLLRDSLLHGRMSLAHNPYGDGKAAGRIVDHLLARFGIGGYSSPRTAGDADAHW